MRRALDIASYQPGPSRVALALSLRRPLRSTLNSCSNSNSKLCIETSLKRPVASPLTSLRSTFSTSSSTLEGKFEEGAKRERYATLEAQRDFFDRAKSKLGVVDQDDWYKVTLQQVYELGGRPLLQDHFKGSLSTALQTVYPYETFLPWRFPNVPAHFWKLKQNRFDYFSNLGKNLRIRRFLDLYKLQSADFKQVDGYSLFSNVYGDRMINAVCDVYPQYSFLIWKFSRTSMNFWRETWTNRLFLDFLCLSLKKKRFADLFSLTLADFKTDASRLLGDNYSFSPSLFIRKNYPEYAWRPWNFDRVPKNYWKSSDSKRAFFDFIGERLGLRSFAQWHKVELAHLDKFNVRGLLNIHTSALSSILSEIYPEFSYRPWDFHMAPKKALDSQQAIRNLIDSVGVSISIRRFSDWYKQSAATLFKAVGGGLSQKFGKSNLVMLQETYPEAALKSWLFLANPKAIWDDEGSVISFIDYATWKMRIRELSDWYRVSAEHLAFLGGLQLRTRLPDVLQRLFPEHKWDAREFTRKGQKKSSQYWLYVCVAELFPRFVTVEEGIIPELKFKSGQPISIDVYVPQLKLGFEYQGAQHYRDSMIYGQSEMYSARDEEKRELCKKGDITLIEVPHWWSGQPEQLRSTVHKRRPDLVPTPGALPPIKDTDS